MQSPPEFAPLIFWVIYERPSDYPEHFVVRRQFVGPDGRRYAEIVPKLAGSLEDARKHVPPDLYRQPRIEGIEDPVIVESWF